MLKLGVMGAGAIGCYVGGRLAARGAEVLFVGRARVKEELSRAGLTLIDLNGASPTTVASASLRVETEPEALSDCDAVLVCVKCAQTAETAQTLARVLSRRAIVVSLQNGVRNADVMREHLDGRAVLGAVVGFNVVSREPGVFRRATSGPLVIEASSDARVSELARALTDAGFEALLSHDIRAHQWSKLVMNLNNAVSALTDVPTPRLIFEAPYRRILAAVMGEAIEVIGRAGVKMKRVGPLPAQLFPTMLKLPTPVLRAVIGVQLKVDPDARSSMWEDLSRRRSTEVDYLNGEIVRLAESSGRRAPINERVVALIRDAERRAEGSPRMPAEALWHALTA